MIRSLLPALLCALPLAAGARTWTDQATGKTIEADFVSATDDSVAVQRPSGKIVRIQRPRLAQADLEFLSGQSGIVNRDRYEEVPPLEAATIPMTGKAHHALDEADRVIREFMARHGIPALSFAVSRDGDIVHERAFGWADAALTHPLQPTVRLRFASLTKPVVAAAIQSLVEEGKLKSTDKVFDLLELNKLPEAGNCDPRWRRVTVQHLLDHRGGWDKEKSGDLTILTRMFMQVFGVHNDELTPDHIVRFALMRRLDFKPGQKSVYSNFGYILLARVIEKASGETFEDFIRNGIARKAGATSFALSTSLSQGREAQEGWYCYHPDYPKLNYSGFLRTEARDGAGGLSSTAADYCRFLESYWISGKPRNDHQRYTYYFYGSFPGVTAVARQRPDGINFTALANRRHATDTELCEELKAALDHAIDEAAEEL